MIITLLLGLFATGNAFASGLCDPCVVRVAPNTSQVEVPLEGWAVPSDTIGIMELSPPAHGTWSAWTETYIPGDSFEAAGVDQMIIDVRTSSGVDDGEKTLIFVLESPNLSVDETVVFSAYPNMQSIQGWTVEGSSQQFKQTSLGNVFPATVQVGPPSRINLDHYGDEVHVDFTSANADPEYSSPGGIISSWMRPEIINIDGVILVVSEIDTDGNLKARARGMYPYFNCGQAPPMGAPANCETALYDVPAPTETTRYYVEVEAAQRVIGHPTEKDWSLRFWVKEQGTDTVLHQEEVWMGELRPEGWPLGGQASFGAMNTTAAGSDQGTVAELSYGSIHISKGQFNNPALMTFTDFEPRNGNDGGIAGDEVLITTGTVETRSVRENAYRYIDVDAMTPLTYPQGFVPATGGDELVTLTDYSPIQAKEAIIEMDLGVVNLPVSTTTVIVELGRIEGALHIGPTNILMKKDVSGKYHFRLRTCDDDLVWHLSDWLVADSNRLRLTVRTKIDDSAAGEPSNGEASLVVDDQSFTFTGLKNTAYPIELVSLGSWWLRYSGAAPTTTDLSLSYDNLLITYN